MAKKLFVVGDSISIFYGVYLRQYLDARFHYDRKGGPVQPAGDMEMHNDANGGDSGMVLAYLKDRLQAGRLDCDILLLNCGLHDIKTDPVSGEKQVPLAQYKENLRAIKALAAQVHADLVWMTTTPVNDQVHRENMREFQRFNDDVVAYNCAAAEVLDGPMIDLYGLTSRLGEAVYMDHVHFTQEVRQLQAAYIAGSLSGLYPA